mgnify:CR=1 FL=1
MADDKGIYYFCASHDSVLFGGGAYLQNAPTFLPFYQEDMDYTLANIDHLVIKDVAEAGGYGVIFGRDLTKDKLEELKKTIQAEPRRFISQEVIDFQDLDIVDGKEVVARKADLRALF